MIRVISYNIEIMAKLTEEKAKEKFADLLEKHGPLYVTDDGNAFVGHEVGKTNANSHASRTSPPMKVWNIKKGSTKKSSKAKSESKTAK